MSVYHCASCGKPFLVYGSLWGYWYGTDACCSYKCMRKMRQEDLKTMNDLNESMTGKPERNRNGYWSTEDRRTALRMRAEGAKITEIAAALNRTEPSVQSWLIKHGAAPANAPADPAPVQIESVLPEPIVKAPVPTIHEAIARTEAAVARVKQAPVVDKARIINVLCDAIELLRELYEATA